MNDLSVLINVTKKMSSNVVCIYLTNSLISNKYLHFFFLSLPLVICLFLAVGGSFEYKHERLYAPLRPKPNQGPV